ncbi:MAG: hypothetical protein Q8R40_04925 [bacterium]|nr:hypothetical protein [bacterium]
MRTIFVSSFEGIETKNILRTPILPTLLRQSDVRIVLFVHDERRVAFHKEEINDPRITYEVVKKPAIRGLDKFFQRFKFVLLKTETTDIRRRMRFDDSKNYTVYYGGLLINRIFSHRLVIQMTRIFDYYAVRNSDFDSYFEKYKPALVVLANLFDEPEVHMLRAAKRYGVKNVGCINSWDKVTARCVLRFLPDKMVVFNDTVKKEVIQYDYMRPEDIFVGGMPQFDYYVTGVRTSREKFLADFGLSPEARFIMYSPIGSSFGNSDWVVIDMLYRLRDEGAFGDNIEILVRFPPNDFIDTKEIARRPYVRYDYPGFHFSTGKVRGSDWELNAKDLRHLADTMAHMSLMVGYASSIAIDASMFDKPSIALNFELSKNPAMKSPMRYCQMIHCQTLFKTGGVKVVNNEKEFVEWAERYLADSSLDRQGRQRLVKEQCVFLDGKCGERIGEFMLSMIR